MAPNFTRPPRVLYFIKGTLPSLDDQLAAEEMAPCVVSFRNAHLVSNVGALEACDAVAGDVPARYKKAYPDVPTAVEAYKKMREASYNARKEEADTAKKAGLDANAADAKAKADKAAEEKKKADEAAKKAKDDADAKAKAAAAWKPNA